VRVSQGIYFASPIKTAVSFRSRITERPERRIFIRIFRNSPNYCLGRLAIEMELGFGELRDGYKDAVGYGKCSNVGVLGGRNANQKK